MEEIKGQRINNLIALFEPINPSFGRLFSNKTERQCLERLINKQGYEKIEELIKKLPEIVVKPFAPVITTPYQLENKLGQLLLFLQREKSSGYRNPNQPKNPHKYAGIED